MRKMPVGTQTVTDYGADNLGRHFWRERGKLEWQGPFATNAEARRNAEIEVFGSQCAIKEGGMRDPAWDKKQ